VVAKLRERISISKWARQKFYLGLFELRKLDDIEVKEEYQVGISNKFVTLENLDESLDIGSAWESIREHNQYLSKRKSAISQAQV
jgi:hypothetical protein